VDPADLVKPGAVFAADHPLVALVVGRHPRPAGLECQGCSRGRCRRRHQHHRRLACIAVRG
jgi:hypothetical protein